MVNIDWLRTKLMFFSIFRYIFKKNIDNSV